MKRWRLKKCFWKVFVRNGPLGCAAFHFFVCGRHHVIWGRNSYQHSKQMRSFSGVWMRIGFIMNNPLIKADKYKVTRPASTHLTKEIQQVGVMTLSYDGQNNTFLTSLLSSSVPHDNIWAVGFTRRETGWRTSQSDSSLSDKEHSTFQVQQLSASTHTECVRSYCIVCTFNHRYTLSLSPHAWVCACTETRHYHMM